MAIRLEDLTRSAPKLIHEERACRWCGYDLRGLRSDGVCPECGRAISVPKPPARFGDQMSAAPIAWLVRYSRGTMLLCVGGWGMAAGLLAWALFGSVACVAFALAASVLWVVGTVVSTHPRPGREGGRGGGTSAASDSLKEWKHMRAWARLTQPAWTLALAGATVTQSLGVFSPWVIVAVSVLLAVGVAGWWPLMLLQSNLAYWASDTELADKLRNCSWASAPGMGIGAAMVGVMGGMTRGLAPRFLALGYFVAGLSMLVWVLLGMYALGYTLSAVWGLMRLGTWAVTTHLNVDDRDERLREKARRARDEEQRRRAERGE